MMNDEMEKFERRLQRQPLKKIPGEWRLEILVATRARQTSRHSPLVTRHWLSTLTHQLSTFFWPHPKAWAALAAVWIFIGALNFSTRDKSLVMAEKVLPPSPEMIVELKKQQRLFAELMGGNSLGDADWPKIFSPKPRSERVEIMMT